MTDTNDDANKTQQEVSIPREMAVALIRLGRAIGEAKVANDTIGARVEREIKKAGMNPTPREAAMAMTLLMGAKALPEFLAKEMKEWPECMAAERADLALTQAHRTAMSAIEAWSKKMPTFVTND